MKMFIINVMKQDTVATHLFKVLSRPNNIFDQLVNLVLAVADPLCKHKALTILA